MKFNHQTYFEVKKSLEAELSERILADK